MILISLKPEKVWINPWPLPFVTLENVYYTSLRLNFLIDDNTDTKIVFKLLRTELTAPQNLTVSGFMSLNSQGAK